MNPRSVSPLALVLASVAVLSSQTLSYGLVYPARYLSKWPLALAIAAGAALALVAAWLSLRSYRRASAGGEKFLAVVAIIVSSFFFFVILFGFGIPGWILGPRD